MWFFSLTFICCHGSPLGAKFNRVRKCAVWHETLGIPFRGSTDWAIHPLKHLLPKIVNCSEPWHKDSIKTNRVDDIKPQVCFCFDGLDIFLKEKKRLNKKIITDSKKKQHEDDKHTFTSVRTFVYPNTCYVENYQDSRWKKRKYKLPYTCTSQCIYKLK
jgi:hypothetical protein